MTSRQDVVQNKTLVIVCKMSVFYRTFKTNPGIDTLSDVTAVLETRQKYTEDNIYTRLFMTYKGNGLKYRLYILK